MKSSVLSLVALLTLTSCTLLNNIIGTILANVAINMPFLLTGIDLLPSGLEGTPEQIVWESLPTNKEKRQDFNYLKNILIIPNKVSANIMGLDVSVQLTAEFRDEDNNDVSGNFKIISLGLNDLPEGFDFDLSSLPFEVDLGVSVYIPVGDSTILEDVNGFNDLESFMETTKQSELIDATNQESLPFSVKIAVNSAKTTKSKTFYFHLTKPEFGTIILDEAFKLGMLVNLFQYRFGEGESPEISFKQDEADDSDSPLMLSFLTDSLIIPKRVTIKDVATVEVDYKFIEGNINNFLILEESRDPSEFTSDPEVLDMIEGEISAYTFTPVGSTYKNKLTEKNIDNVDAFADHIKEVTTDHVQSDLEDLYKASQSDPFNFELELTVKSGEETRPKSFYFGMKKAMLDAQILDFVIENEKIVQKVEYTDTTDPIEVTSDTVDLEMLTETLAFPESITLPGFDTRSINFSLDFENEADKDLFYTGSQELSAETTGLDGAELEVQTLTPIGEYKPKPEDDTLEKFAATIQGMFDNDVEGLYNIVSYEHDTPIKVSLTASLEKDGVVTESRAREITIELKPADVDKEIIDYLIDNDQLLNIVNYENIEEIQDSENDPTDYIRQVGRTPENITIPVEHLADTIIIPSEITHEKFAGKKLRITHTVTSEGEELDIFESFQNIKIDNFDISADTITSTGGYETTTKDLKIFADEILDLDTKDLYEHSQAEKKKININLVISLLDKDEKVTESRNKTFEIEFVPAHIDEKKIGDAIFATGGENSPYSVVNVLNADVYLDADAPERNSVPLTQIPVPVDENEVHTAHRFFDTIVFPEVITFTDFGNTEVVFDHSLHSDDVANIDDYFFKNSKNHLIDGTEQTVQTLTPVAGFDAEGNGIEDFDSLLGVLNTSNPFDPVFQALWAANNELPTEVRVTLTINIKINGEDAGSRDYYFVIVPADLFG